jgi:2-dehydropantoate 2-reductase
MRVCIVGAGAIGCLVAARLAAQGEEVSLIARGQTLSAIRLKGVTLMEAGGHARVVRDLVAGDDPAAFGEQDLVVLAVKAHHLHEVAPRLPCLYHDRTVVLPMQNGIPWWFFQKFGGPFDGHRLEVLDPEGMIERHVPSERIVGSIAFPAVHRVAPAVVRHVEGDRFPVGELDDHRSERAEGIARLLNSAGLRSRVLTDIRANVWIKAWGNLAFNPISALTGATLGEMCRFEATRMLAEHMMHEALDVAERLGIRVRLSVEQRIKGAEAVGGHKTSMLQDLEAGRPLEVEALVGAFVELGRLTGTPMPATELVYGLVSLVNERRSG